MPPHRTLAHGLILLVTVTTLTAACAPVRKECGYRPEPAGRKAPPPPAPVLSQDALRADLQRLVRLLEESHPDPYSGTGGRVAFHRMAHDVEAALPKGGLTAKAFLRRVRPLVASIGDGHTHIRAPRAQRRRDDEARLALELDVAGRAVHVSGVFREADRPLLGGRLVAVEGVAVEELLRRQGRMRGHDNAYNNLVHLIESLSTADGLAELFEGPAAPKMVRLILHTADGAQRTVEIPVGPVAKGHALRPPSKIALPKVNAADLGWGFLDDQRRVALLRIDSAMRYREAFEVWRAAGFERNLQQHLTDVASAATGAKPPATVDARIAAVPSATETFRALFAALKEHQTETLIVDLRRNGGGNSAISTILAVLLDGKAGLHWHRDAYQVPRYSALYFENHSKVPQAELLRRKGLRLGGYDFSEQDAWLQKMRTGKQPPEEGDPLAPYERTPTFLRHLRSGAEGFAPPRVIALTSARTYSAGFDVAAMLYRRGAAIVGVPSAQAGNCFIDTLGFELPRSRLTGSISFKRSLLFPADERAGRLLRPDVELTYEALAKMGFDPNAAVRLALRRAREKPDVAREVARVDFVWRSPLDGALAWLRHRYRLDAVLEGQPGELARLVALRNWVHGRWEHHCCNLPRRSDALSILAEAEQGQRFRCVEYALVLAQVYRAMGWCARFVRLQGAGGAHAVTEVFSRELGKWILMDGQHAAHVTADGAPLSALELRARLAAKQPVTAHVDGHPVDYPRWMAPLLDYVMVPLDASYGRELDALVVLVPEGLAPPQRKPPYLRWTRYVVTRDAALLAGARCAAEKQADPRHGRRDPRR